MVHHGLGLALRTGRWFLRGLGVWGARRWWPTPRMLSAVQVVCAVPTNSPNEDRPNVRINLGAHELRLGLDLTNLTPYDIELVGFEVVLVVDGVECANLACGPEGMARCNGGQMRIRLRHSMTDHEQRESTRAARGQSTVEGLLIVRRLIRSRAGFHRDEENARMRIPVTCRVS